ncbi:MAG: DinB family protein [Flavobacteriales bacterium]|jgi:hypothetical protein|nr:DinB family protein [Flavobacteriales bacterium]MBK7085170.1 DinB family protein [Flavobacteriales bacterium]MBK7270215.1 DinB family protein [Flavobacteriales bacterium]MBK9075888.1 DinB family protein [Flavobacteriales bacterium]MBK9537346.1 DinB family protein [Flavobacteriales bacterium]
MIVTGIPDPAEIPTFYQRYVAQVGGNSLFEGLLLAAKTLRAAMERVRPEQEEHRYAPGKWSVKEVVQHVIDAERIFAYRALRFARNDATPLPGFEENDYAPAARCERRTLADLQAEYGAVHHATLELFVSMDGEMLLRTGIANGNRISVRALGWTIAGHTLHHARILTERYLDHGTA